MSKNPQDLYQSVILRHNREPVGYEKHEEAGWVIEAYNPLCGDQFRLYLTIRDDRVAEAHFYGYGCAISKASTSVLIARIRGRAVGEVRQLIGEFLDLIRGEAPPPEDTEEELLAFTAVRDFPARLSCVTLSWDSLRKRLEGP